MVGTATVDRLAEELYGAQRDAVARSPLSDTVSGLTVEDAYAVQSRFVERRLAEGRLVRGRKVGLTSRAMQEMLGVTEPDFGALLDDMFVAEDDQIDLGRLIAPRIEAELAFVLGADLRGPGVLAVQVPVAVEGICPALEIIDSRIADWRIGLVDTVADNASSALVVLGAALSPLGSRDLRLTGGVLTRNAQVEATGAGAAVLGNPLRCVAWLANKLAEFGEGLVAGDVVLSGALHAAIEMSPGDVFRAELSGLGAVTARCSAA